jgi:hypothetical protein
MARPHGIPDAQWRDWVWQMQERVRSTKDLERYINPTDDERRAIDALVERFRFVITPYYASLMDPDDPTCQIRKQVVPRTVELDDPAGLGDPLDEVAHSPAKNVIRVYPDRIAFCVNNECALYASVPTTATRPSFSKAPPTFACPWSGEWRSSESSAVGRAGSRSRPTCSTLRMARFRSATRT